MRPILYSFRRCPYAIRARMALRYAGVECELREVVLKHKPPSMLQYSPKGTVPVLVLKDKVLDESIDVLHWALSDTLVNEKSVDSNNTKSQLAVLLPSQEQVAASLVARNDGYFKYYLDRYKYSDRYPEYPESDYFDAAMVFINELQELLLGRDVVDQNGNESDPIGLLSPRPSWVDIAIFPFVRQFAHVDKNKFDGMAIAELQSWLAKMLSSSLFLDVMQKYPAWQEGDTITKF